MACNARVSGSEETTNATRLVAAAGIAFVTAGYDYEEDGGAEGAARKLGVDPEVVYKTLVATGEKSGIAVFCVPAGSELDLKKAARASGNKQVRLVPQRDLKPLTGYVRGGCSPIGMIKRYPVYVEELAQSLERMYINGGRRGVQLILAPDDLLAMVNGVYADLV